jgi:hypothetical protein
MRRRAALIFVVMTALVASATGSADGGLPSVVDLGASATGLRIDGAAAGGRFGDAALAIGDLDGDGAADLVVGAPAAAGGRGAVYVVFGPLASRDLATSPADLTITGAGSNVGLGIAAAVVDLDADGAGELVVSTSGYLPVLGRFASGGALVFRGGPGLRGRGSVDLAVERADAAVFDSSIPEPAGAALAGGDFDADGYADLAVGSPTSPGLDGAGRAGRTFVVFGGPAFPAGRGFDVASDDAVVIVGGKGAGDGLGSHVVAADADGDRAADLLLGTPDRTVVRAVTFEKAGSLFVVAGSDLRPGARVDLAAAPATVEVLGSDFGDYVGRGSGVGDLTGDGRPDLVVSAIDGDGPMNKRYPDCGEIYVLEPFAAPPPVALDLMQRPQWEWILGPAPRRFLGNALAVGDLDGDRRAEIVAASDSAPGPNGAAAGALYVVGGEAGTYDLASVAAATTVLGPSSSARLGSALVAADVDGDGTRDVVAGAPGAAGGRGSVFVIFGVRTAPDAAPTIAPVADVRVAAGQTATVDFAASDADGDTVRFSILDRPAGSTFEDRGDGTARLTFSPGPESAAHYDVRLRASDGQLSSEVSFAVEVVAGAVPRVVKAVYRGGALKVTGENFAASATLTVNDRAVTLPVAFKPARGRLVVRGTAAELNLNAGSGTNRVVVTVDGVASAPFAF